MRRGTKQEKLPDRQVSSLTGGVSKAITRGEGREYGSLRAATLTSRRSSVKHHVQAPGVWSSPYPSGARDHICDRDRGLLS